MRSRSHRLAVITAVFAAAVAVGGCEGADSGGTTVAIESFKYAPTPATVKAGTTVRIDNRDSAQHTLTSTDVGEFDSGTVAAKTTVEVKFTKPGSFAYICQFHPFMKGTVTVTP
jgi:plastocyanin